MTCATDHVLVLYCHPRPDSFTAAVRDRVLERLAAAGAEVRLRDLYAESFDPAMSGEEHAGYEDTETNQECVAQDCRDVLWADALIFVYPTWWYGLPAALKGWLDRALLPGVAFHMPSDEHPDIRPGLTHITRMGVFTTCGASRLLTFAVGAPGKRTLMRGIGWLMAPRARRVFAAHYLMDGSTAESRARHLERVAARVDKLMRPGSWPRATPRREDGQ